MDEQNQKIQQKGIACEQDDGWGWGVHPGQQDEAPHTLQVDLREQVQEENQEEQQLPLQDTQQGQDFDKIGDKSNLSCSRTDKVDDSNLDQQNRLETQKDSLVECLQSPTENLQFVEAGQVPLASQAQLQSSMKDQAEDEFRLVLLNERFLCINRRINELEKIIGVD
eukprot:TRINITY_DN3179_c0_g1_i5.p3 TRINITY_DN3179_c0_g1~~TRINITY_DN3179_c0_g1_i5.p3  ORF type:complete len:167 (-),score=31.34 TRINITY_DN3179_c0_g1_i5:471-971(-)